MTQPPPHFLPPQPAKNRTNTIIIGSAAALIAVIVGTGLYVANSRDTAPDPAAAPAVTVTAPAEEPAATPSMALTPECRTWIKAELLDSTETIDATPGYEACGYLSSAELDAAIEQVTAELSAEITPDQG